MKYIKFSIFYCIMFFSNSIFSSSINYEERVDEIFEIADKSCIRIMANCDDKCFDLTKSKYMNFFYKIGWLGRDTLNFLSTIFVLSGSFSLLTWFITPDEISLIDIIKCVINDMKNMAKKQTIAFFISLFIFSKMIINHVHKIECTEYYDNVIIPSQIIVYLINHEGKEEEEKKIKYYVNSYDHKDKDWFKEIIALKDKDIKDSNKELEKLIEKIDISDISWKYRKSNKSQNKIKNYLKSHMRLKK